MHNIVQKFKDMSPKLSLPIFFILHYLPSFLKKIEWKIASFQYTNKTTPKYSHRQSKHNRFRQRHSVWHATIPIFVTFLWNSIACACNAFFRVRLSGITCWKQLGIQLNSCTGIPGLYIKKWHNNGQYRHSCNVYAKFLFAF